MPPLSAFLRATPDVARPAAPADELRLTWLGQSGFLIQIGGVNVLTDPVLSERASPFAAIGPRRIVPAALSVADLPDIDVVLLSHDHYDHLDARTMAGLIERFGPELSIVTPLGYTSWFNQLGARRISELDWWQDARFSDALTIVALPAQHWSRRGLSISRRLWCSWLIRAPHQTVYFCGDSGYCPAFKEIGERAGPIDVALMPIGAYEPRWFMKAAHMNPEEAVQAAADLGAREFVGMHWGTFRLTDEPMLEPSVRARAAWHERGLEPEQLHIPQHGETLKWRAQTRSTT